MQIHELNKTTLVEVNMLGTGGVADRIKTGAKTLATQTGSGAALGQAVTPGMNQGATNTAKFNQSTWMDLYRATQMNQATQSWIDGLLKQWKMQAAKLPQNITATPTPSTPAPTTPALATTAATTPVVGANASADGAERVKNKLTALKQKRQGLREADERSMNPDAWKEQFLTWSDNMLKTRARNTGAEINMDMVRRDPDAQKHLPSLLSAVVDARGTSEFDDAFKKYMQMATAGIYKLTQIENNRTPTAGATPAQYQAPVVSSGQLPDNITRLFKSMGVANPSQADVDRLARFLKSEGISGVGNTGSPSLDALFKRMGLSK